MSLTEKKFMSNGEAQGWMLTDCSVPLGSIDFKCHPLAKPNTAASLKIPLNQRHP
jgi:hypothetical protein